jgi:hypothetical protein
MLRNLLVVFLFSLLEFDLFSQTLLTNQEVYDLKVGEALKYKVTGITYDDTPGGGIVSIENRFRNDSILSKTVLPGSQTVSYSARRSSNLVEPQGIDTICNVHYPYNSEPVKYQFFPWDTLLKPDTIELLGQPGNIPAVGFHLNGFDTVAFMNYQSVIFIKGFGGPFLLDGRGDGLGGPLYTSTFQLSKIGQAPVTINFSITEAKRKKSSLAVHPNPFKHQIRLPESAIGDSYQIYNLQGKSITRGIVQKSILEVANLQPGLYQLEVSSPKNGERKTARIIKE